MSTILKHEDRKALGAFYTDEAVARFLVSWALRKGRGAVLDPSCGDGRFLEIAGRLGARRLVGCDLSGQALQTARDRLRTAGLDMEAYASDFFALEPEAVEPVEAVVGNPPFIRYQRFTGESRRRALRSALRLGVRLSRLTSSWAPFLLHAVQFLRPGGDLAMVVPAEITQTHYGLATLRALLGRFGMVRLLAFERNFFPDALQETCLLLAADRGAACEEVRLLPLESVDDLRHFPDLDQSSDHWVEVPVAENTVVRFAEAFLEPPQRRAWARARRHSGVRSIAALANVVNGYVTGANEFFHQTRREADEAGYPATWHYPTARSSRSLKGLYFTSADVTDLESQGTAHHLLVPQHDLFDPGGDALARFLEKGELAGVPRRYKCRQREPWWKVPGLHRADLLVGYMAGEFPRAAVNRAKAYYTNSLHGLQLREGVSPELLALSFYSSLTLLSLEIEGRSYGGGILKLEPRELDRVLVAWPKLERATIAALARAVDGMLRAGQYQGTVEAVDRVLLVEGLGLSPATVQQLAGGRRRLLERRLGRARGGRRGSPRRDQEDPARRRGSSS